MINSQIPYNQLNSISDVKLPKSTELNTALEGCRNLLFHLNGYIDAMGDSILPLIRILHIVDSKFSFELEDYPISLHRLFEALSSENKLQDATAKMISNDLEIYLELNPSDSESLFPVYLNPKKQKQDFLREKQEVKISSYHTNLTLYTAPTQPQVMQRLKKELSSIISKWPVIDPLLLNALLHYQIRALAPYQSMNGHAARNLSRLLFRRSGFLCDEIPISVFLYRDRENYNRLIAETAYSGNAENWTLFFLKIIENAAAYLLGKLKRMQLQKSVLFDRLNKYTEYPLPAVELSELLFESPYIKVAMVSNRLNCHRQTAATLLMHLSQMGILSEKNSGREKLYFHQQLLDIAGSA